MNLPFAVELRCLFDFVFTKTSLDVFQFWQCFVYHVELYLAHFGNQSYVVKIMGNTILFPDDYCIGFIGFFITMTLMIGPIYFFSEFSTFSVANPVLSSNLQVSIVVNKTLSLKDLVNRMVPKPNKSPI